MTIATDLIALASLVTGPTMRLVRRRLDTLPRAPQTLLRTTVTIATDLAAFASLVTAATMRCVRLHIDTNFGTAALAIRA